MKEPWNHLYPDYLKQSHTPEIEYAWLPVWWVSGHRDQYRHILPLVGSQLYLISPPIIGLAVTSHNSS